MDLDSDIEIAIGPYEVYEDGLFNYKAAFESFVTVRDKAESAHLAVYAQHLPDMERNLPIPDAHKNFNRKFESPIRVVQEAFTAGDARRGVQTSAFNLPNDERVREAKGSKKVLLKNVMEAKFRQSGRPVAERVIDPSQAGRIAFDAYFNHTLFHELSHGLGPGVITGPDGKRVEGRLLLKNIYSTIEECKADVVGLWNIFYALDQKWLTSFDEDSLSATYMGLMFRSMRFGLEEAHGGGTAVQWNWFREKGAIVPSKDGRFVAHREKFREAVRSLANELLMIEATGDFDRGKRLLDRYGKSNAEIEATNARLKDIPVDIKPVFVAAREKTDEPRSKFMKQRRGDRHGRNTERSGRRRRPRRARQRLSEPEKFPRGAPPARGRKRAPRPAGSPRQRAPPGARRASRDCCAFRETRRARPEHPSISGEGVKSARRALGEAGAASKSTIDRIAREWKKMDAKRRAQFVAALLGALAAASAPIVRSKMKKR